MLTLNAVIIEITAVFSDNSKFGNVMIPFERSSGKFYRAKRQ
jgi:hypothetical protein